MGYNTDYLGHIDVDPPLNDAEIEYLTAFGSSRRCIRPGGPYEVPGNPRAETSDAFEGDDYNQRAPGQPNLWCDWTPCWDGCCIAWNGTEKSYSMIPWLRYLIQHFLKPGAPSRFATFPMQPGRSSRRGPHGVVARCRNTCAAS